MDSHTPQAPSCPCPSVIRSSSGRVCCETTSFPQKSNEFGQSQEDQEQGSCWLGWFPHTRSRLHHILSKLGSRAPAKKKKSGSRLIGFQTVPVEDANRNVEPGSPVVTCIGQVRPRKQINKNEFGAAFGADSKKQCSSSNSKWRGFCLRCQLPKEEQGMQHQSVQPPSWNGSVLAKSLVLLQQQMELAGDGSRDRSTGVENDSAINMVQSGSGRADVGSLEPVATKVAQVGGDESCLWRRRRIPQPKLLELNKSMPVVV